MKRLKVLILVMVALLLVGCAAKEPAEPTIEELLAKKGYEVSNEYFFRAARYGDVDAVKLLLEAGIYIDVREMSDKWPGATALIYACDRGREDVVEYLIEQGADIEAKTDNGHTPLYMDNVDVVKILIDNGAEVSFRVGFSTPLHTAIFNDNLEMVKLLVESGADINIQASTLFETPLTYAEGKAEIVEYLRSVGAKPY